MSLPSPLLHDVSLAARVSCEQSMRFEIHRFGTFSSFPKENKHYILRLAQAGFYYTNIGDEVECYICALRKHGWSGKDIPIEVHKSLSPDCPFLLQNSTVNVPVGFTVIQRNPLRHQSQNHLQVRSAQTPFELWSLQAGNGNQNNQISRQVANPVFGENNGASTKYPRYASLNVRQASFHNCDRIALTPVTLAKAGFFYTGHGDLVRCFQCGVDLYQWSEGANAWIEHFKWSKDCLLVKQAILRRQIFSNSVHTIDAQDSENGFDEEHASQNWSGHGDNRNDSTIEDMTALFEDNQRMIDRHYCIHCRMVLRSVIFLNCPTPHILTCNTCAVHHDRCPLCNTVIKALLYLPR